MYLHPSCGFSTLCTFFRVIGSECHEHGEGYRESSGGHPNGIFDGFMSVKVGTNSDVCADDYVAVTEKESHAGLIADEKKCGTSIEKSNLRLSKINILFKLTVSTENKGFTVKYTAVHRQFEKCSRNLTVEEAPKQLQVPEQGNLFPADFRCTYAFAAPADKLVDVQFTKFKHDHLGLNVQRIILHSIEVNKTEIDSASCSNNLSVGDEEEILQVPGSGEKWGSNYRCTYMFQAPSNMVVQMAFKNFRIGTKNDCTTDYVIISQNENLNTAEENKLCGKNIPHIALRLERVYVHLVKTKQDMEDKFVLTYKAVTPMEAVCPDSSLRALESSQRLQLPADGAKLSAEFKCTIHISAGSGKYVELDFESFEFGSSVTCTENYLIVSERNDKQNGDEKKLCGNQNPKVELRASSIYIHVVTSKENSGIKFRLAYTSLDKRIYTCDATVKMAKSIEKILEVPETNTIWYPDFYCTFEFRAREGNLVDLTFMRFNFSHPMSCKLSHVIISIEKDARKASEPKICGSAIPTITLRASTLYVHVVKYTSISDDQFTLTYKSEHPVTPVEFKCTNLNLSASESEKKLTLPASGTKWTENCNFSIHINSEPGKLINLTFTSFEIGDLPCSLDYIAVGKDNEMKINTNEKYCGSVIPKFELYTSPIYVHVEKSTPEPDDHFELVYRSVDTPVYACDQTAKFATTTLQNMVVPSVNTNWGSSFNCTFEIQAPQGEAVQLIFQEFKFGDAVDCGIKYISVGEVKDEPSANDEKWCGSTLPSNLIESSRLYIHVINPNPEMVDKFSFSYISGMSIVSSK
ncbi:hypothetical protein FGIG_01616 [Fasciola gigantica]|uniref:CUB domain-containing protein n=1 Tax=Fasciola gigantica TaxID=46835 RepID=A0A504Y9P1_FASGI|nr:hypothetical protein FGIG_01616 [Fasciola gigantica]